MDTESGNFLFFWGSVLVLLFAVSIGLLMLERRMKRWLEKVLPGGNFSGRVSRNIRIGLGPDGRISEEERFSIITEPDQPPQWETDESTEVRPLSDADRDRYRQLWQRTEALFFKRPGDAVRDADQLVTDLMRDTRRKGVALDTSRTFEGSGFESVAAMKEAFRFAKEVKGVANAIALAKEHRESEVNIVDLKRAMDHYRQIFEKIVGG